MVIRMPEEEERNQSYLAVNPMNYTNGHPGKTYHLHISVVGVINHFVIGLDLRPAPQVESHT